MLVRPSRQFGLGLSARKGATIEARAGDSVVSEADVPDRIGAGVSYEGIPGTSISVHVSRDMWSSLNGLGSSAATAVDTWEAGGGINFYPSGTRSWRLNLHLLHIDRSPVSSLFSYYQPGQRGTIFSLGTDLLI